MEKEKIEEIVLSPEQLEVLEVGGARRMDIESVKSILTYTISNIVAVKTAWGNRIDFTLKDEFGESILSDWNIHMKKKYKAVDLLAKKVTIEPNPKNPKKVILNVLD